MLAVLLLTPPGNVTFSAYNSETDHTTHYIRNGRVRRRYDFPNPTKGIASILMLSEGKYLESVESPTDGTDTILFINGSQQTVVKGCFRSIYQGLPETEDAF